MLSKVLHIPICRVAWFCCALAFLLSGQGAFARLGVAYQMALGNPDNASTNTASRTKYLIQRSQYVLSYNDDTHEPNWVSWSITTNGLGTVVRSGDGAFAVEELLPSGFSHIGPSSFGTKYGINWDRGHMTPSSDRTQSTTDNEATFRMSNIIPQAATNNRTLWADFEAYCRTLANSNQEVLIISGPSEFTGNRIDNTMAIPGWVWKIAVVLTNASSTEPISQRVSTATRVIALRSPNVNAGLGTWKSYITSVEKIEDVTGFNFFTSITNASTAIYLKNVVDTGTESKNPTVITTFNPTLGAPGAIVTISGYNFDTNSTVKFNGVAASSVICVNTNQLTAVVPIGATTGPITATGTGGVDISYEDFTVTRSGSISTITLSPTSISGFSATKETAGQAKIYAVNGGNLTTDVNITAPANFEIGTNGISFGTSSVLTPDIDGSLGAQVYVRIKADAVPDVNGEVSGDITHTSAGATAKVLAVTGIVTPKIQLSTKNLSGFSALVGNASASKSYTVSGADLAGSITISATNGYEISLDNSNFALTQTLTTISGKVPTTTVYARLSSSAVLGDRSADITHSATGAPSQNLAVIGKATTAASTVVRLAAWDFTGESDLPTSVADVFNDALDADYTLTRGIGATASLGNNSFRTQGFKNDGISTTNADYFQFSFSSLPGANLSMNSITARFAGTSTYYASPGVSNQFSYSTNGTNFVLIGSPLIVTNSGTPLMLDLASISALQNLNSSATVTFRFYASGQTTTGGWGFYSSSSNTYGLDVSGSFANVLPPAPAITVAGPANAAALVFFSDQVVANNSPTSYAASGLPPGLSIDTSSGVISGTPTTPGSYTVGLIASNANGDGTATLTINVQANANAPAITSNLIAYGQINTAFGYQIVASNSPTSYTAANLPDGLSINTSTGSISGAPTTGGTFSATITAINAFGSDSKTLLIIARVPSVTLTPATLNAFTANAGFPSATQSYTLSGSELTDGITVQAPQHFEVSTDGVNFTGETTLSPAANGSLFQTVIVRVANTAPPGLMSGAINHSGSGAVPKYLEVSATVSTSVPTLTLSTAGLADFSTVAGTASTIQTYEVSGASLTGKITITPSAGFEIGASEVKFTDFIEVSPVNGALDSTTVYVRMRANASAGTYNGNITHSGGGTETKTIAVSGTIVTKPIGPNIVATSGGSAYVNTPYSYTITTDGQQAVTSYSASGLPADLSINTSTGEISGTPKNAGSYIVTLFASNTQSTSSVSYNLRIVSPNEQSDLPLSVVVNKYQNSGAANRVELLVTGDNVNGPPVDLRGMTIKDFSSDMASDNGGKYVFNDHPLWANVKAGTLVVLAVGNSSAEDLDASDFILRVNLSNPTYFTEASGGFDLGSTDMVMVKAAGMGADGVAGGIHALAAGTPGGQYTGFSGKKMLSPNPLTPESTYAYVVNSTSSISDFYSASGADDSDSLTFGAANNSANNDYIDSLRRLDQTPPVVALNSDASMTIALGATFNDPGATASDDVDGFVSVQASGNVNTAAPGTYVITYTAADGSGNTASSTRSVQVLSAAAYTLQFDYGLSGAQAGLSADADADGVSNLTEYALGRNPASASDATSSAPAVRIVGTNLEISAMLRNDMSLIVAAEVSSNLTTWTDTASEQSQVDQTGVAPGFTRRTWQWNASGMSRQFIRLRISAP